MFQMEWYCRLKMAHPFGIRQIFAQPWQKSVVVTALFETSKRPN